MNKTIASAMALAVLTMASPAAAQKVPSAPQGAPADKTKADAAAAKQKETARDSSKVQKPAPSRQGDGDSQAATGNVENRSAVSESPRGGDPRDPSMGRTPAKAAPDKRKGKDAAPKGPGGYGPGSGR